MVGSTSLRLTLDITLSESSFRKQKQNVMRREPLQFYIMLTWFATNKLYPVDSSNIKWFDSCYAHVCALGFHGRLEGVRGVTTRAGHRTKESCR